MIYVPGCGPNDAKIAIVGEAPGQEEEAQGRPFVGSSGRIIDRTLREAGIDPESVYRTNVVKVRPPNNNIARLSELGKTIEDFLDQLWEELDLLKPNVVIAVGNTALTALTGHKGIIHYRGSILRSVKGNHKVIPTVHPASILHKEGEGMSSWKDLVPIQWDFGKAKSESLSREIDIPVRNLVVAHNNLDVYRFFDRFADSKEVSVDIETWRTFPICIGFAFNRTDAISIPLFNSLPGDDRPMSRPDMIQSWKDIADLLANPSIRKIGQNFKFDGHLLDKCYDERVAFGLKVRGLWFDTMLAFKTLYPELPAKLEFQTSVLTKEPYYKEEGKEYNPKKDKLSRLLLYNARDAVVTYEVYERELCELQQRKQDKFFFEFIMPLSPFYSRLESVGIKRDDYRHKFLEEKYKLQKQEMREEFDALTSEFGLTGVNVNSNGMKNQVAKLVFGAMALPLRHGTDEKTLDAISRNNARNDKERRILKLILELRKVGKTIGTYINAKPHHDGRIRTSVNIVLESGRTGTRILKPPVATEKMGSAFQTITKQGEFGSDLRSMYVPDPGYVLIEPDLSQAEARVVAVLAKDDKLKKMFDFGVDVHLVTFNWISPRYRGDLLQQFFDEPDPTVCRKLAKELKALLKSVITDSERQVGKKFRHAGHYDMGPEEASRQVGLPEFVTKKILAQFHSTNDKIKNVFHKEIQEALKVDRRLISPNGRNRLFMNRWGDKLFKEGYAQIPQSTVTDQTKKAMRLVEQRCPKIIILEESHDSFLAQAPVDVADKYFPVIKEELESPINFKNCTLSRDVDLIIPCEIKIGESNWEEMKQVM